jgi:hypothetical protein
VRIVLLIHVSVVILPVGPAPVRQGAHLHPGGTNVHLIVHPGVAIIE